MFVRMEKPMKLFLRIEKINNSEVSQNEVQVPIKQENLELIKEVAENERKRDIPKLQKI